MTPVCVAAPAAPQVVRRPSDVATHVAAAALAGVGAVLLAFTYQVASAGGRPFALLWVAFALLFVPAGWLLTRSGDGPRIPALALLTFASALPKLLRSPSRPVFSDEFAHMREVVNLTEGWDLFVSNSMVRMASEFPGMHRAVANVALTLGIEAWPAAVSVVGVAHGLLLFGVFTLAGRFVSPRAAGVAALVYATNPSFLLFDMQVAYESFALPLAVWALLAGVLAVQATRPVARVGFWSVATLLASAVLVSHHLSAIMLAAVLLLTIGGSVTTGRRLTARGAGVTGVTAGVLAGVPVLALWLVARPLFDQLYDYLSPSLRLISSPTRRPFEGSSLPMVEQVFGIALPVVLLGLGWWAVWRLRDTGAWWRLPPVAIGLSTVALLLPVSFPLLLLSASAEGARRSWAWSYLGLAVLVALAIDTLDRADRPRVRAVVAIGCASVLLIGGVAVSQNETYRLPGQWQSALDARAHPGEVWLVAEAIAPLVEWGDRVLADRYVRGPIALAAPVEILTPSDSAPLWDVLFVEDPAAGSAKLLVDNVRFVVVDVRMGDRPPTGGFWFNRHEPPGARLVPGAFDQLDILGDRVVAAGPYIVWQLHGRVTAAPTKEN